MTASRRKLVRWILASGQAVLALVLLAHFWVPRMIASRPRERADQMRIEAEARAGAGQADGWDIKVCYFGAPKEISAMAMADLPVLLTLGPMVVPSNTRDELMRQRPHWPLPSTRMAMAILLFGVGVWVQWWVLSGALTDSSLPIVWWTVLAVLPMACVPVALLGEGARAGDFLRLGALPYWGLLLPSVAVITALSKRRTKQA